MLSVYFFHVQSNICSIYNRDLYFSFPKFDKLLYFLLQQIFINQIYFNIFSFLNLDCNQNYFQNVNHFNMGSLFLRLNIMPFCVQIQGKLKNDIKFNILQMLFKYKCMVTGHNEQQIICICENVNFRQQYRKV
ncbi:hypothetical protein pb186bvf_017484 [Paramecium bursaria]